jgi:anti-sigma28 factor (negative regulator of flagellin synthesis)
MKMNRDMEEKGVCKSPRSVGLLRGNCRISFMKAQKLRQEDNTLIFPPEKVAHTRKMMGPLQQEKPKERTSILQEQLAQRDIEAVRHSLEHLKTRNERIEALKLQVNTGTYQLDSINVAQKMVGSSQARKILNAGGFLNGTPPPLG